RQDRKVAPRTPITARLVADLITSAGADRFLSMDLHAGQIQGFFDMPSDHLYASPILLEDMKRKYGSRTDDVVVVSPDAGGVERIQSSVIEEVVVTNTIPLRENALGCRKITQLSVAKIFGEAIRRIHSGDSLSSLFV